jgi:hypothetical protein
MLASSWVNLSVAPSGHKRHQTGESYHIGGDWWLFKIDFQGKIGGSGRFTRSGPHSIATHDRHVIPWRPK